jgi:hypothetical protein
MPNMRVWFVWNQRTSAVCAWEGCGEVIGTVEPCVQGVLSYEGTPSRRFRWHPQCYVDQGLAYLKDHPPLEQARGHRTNRHFSSEQQQYRHALVAKKSRIKKLKGQAVEHGFWWKMKSLEEATRAIDLLLEAMENSNDNTGT